MKPLLILNELGEKSQGTITFGCFGKIAFYFYSLAFSFPEMFFIGQNLKQVPVTFSLSRYFFV